MINVWDNLSKKERKQLEYFKRFENRHRMAPDYLYDKNDKKTLMAYRNLIDCLEPERPIEYSYQPMDLLTTNKKDYIPHPVKPMQQLIQIQKLNNLAMQRFTNNKIKGLLPDLDANQGYEYEWLFLERNPTKPVNKHLNDEYIIDSTYSRDFKAFPRSRSRPPVRQDCLSIRPDSRIEDTTSYTTDFTEHKLPAYYFLPRDDDSDIKKTKTDKRYFSPTEQRLIKGYYNPHFNLENALLKEAVEKQRFSNDAKKYVTMRPKYQRTKSLNFDMYSTTPERTAIFNQNVKFRVLETSNRKQ